MKKLIITADDYGMSLAVNKAIDEGIEAGLITSTNLMTNMPYAEDAVTLKNYKNFSVGIHFTLTCGCPVSDAAEIPTLVSKSGEFYTFSDFRKRYRKNLIHESDILHELNAQYERYIQIMGIKPEYWNTHQNVHVDFRIYKLFVDFAVEKEINRMRSHQRLYVKESNANGKRSLKWRLLEPFKSHMLNSWQKKSAKKGIASPDGIVVCLNKKDASKPEYVFNNIAWGDNHIAEYVIHPAIENDSPYFGRIVEKRIDEYILFTSSKTKELIDNAEIDLVGFYM